MDYDTYLDQNPLIHFSPYTHAQTAALKRIGAEIEATLDHGIHDGQFEFIAFERVYDLFWLWILGAFEVTRTMHEGRRHFSDRLRNQLASQKKLLIELRSPFAKQILNRPSDAKHDKRVHGELSIANVDAIKKDMAYQISGNTYWVKQVIRDYLEILDNITPTDVGSDRIRGTE